MKMSGNISRNVSRTSSMIRTTVTLTAFALPVLMISCSAAVPPAAQYLLRAETVERAARTEAPVRIGLGRITVAPYLDQSGIVVETEPGRIEIRRDRTACQPRHRKPDHR